MIEPVAKFPERTNLRVRRHTGDNVPGETADDVGFVGSEAELENNIADDRGEGIPVVEAERRQLVTAPAKLHRFIEPHPRGVSRFPQGLRGFVAVGSRLVQGVLRRAQRGILSRDERPSIRTQPLARRRHASFAPFATGSLLDGFQLLDPRAFQMSLAGLRIYGFRGETVLNRQGVCEHPFENGIIDEFRIYRLFHVRKLTVPAPLRNAPFGALPVLQTHHMT